MRTLFLHPPSFDGFDGGAGSRYQAKREIRSFWYPTWLAQPAALVPGSRAARRTRGRLVRRSVARDRAALRSRHHPYEHAVVSHRCAVCGGSEEAQPVAHDRHGRRQGRCRSAQFADAPARRSISSAAKNSTSPARKSPRQAARADPGPELPRARTARSSTTKRGPILENMDELPFVAPVYKRDLKIENYFIGYLKHPYVSIYTGRGCRSKCTFCLWPQTVGGHRYRTRRSRTCWKK